LAPDDYPSLPVEQREDDTEGVTMKVDGELLGTGLSQVVRSASTDDSRQVLTGVLWELENGTLTLAATDSYRLGARTLAVEGAPPEPRKVVLPARALAELVRALQASASSVVALVKENLISFSITSSEAEGSARESVIASRFIEGEFPNYRQLIPSGYPNVLTVERELLLEVTKRVGLLAQNNLPVKLRLDSELEISAHTPDVGEGQELVAAEYKGESLVIAFNPQFLFDGVSAMQTQRVVLEAGDGLKPAVIRGEGDESFTYLLMPVRLS
jgi:DNA polymerase-3 subunit beta